MPRTRAASTTQQRDSAVVRDIKPTPPIPRSRIPRPLRFPLLALTSYTLSIFLLGLGSRFMHGELMSVSRRLNENWHVLGMLGWRTIELAIGWFGGYDDVDIASLGLLSNIPRLYLLFTFYQISFQTCIIELVSSLVSISLPTMLLRPRSALHIPWRAAQLPNHSIMQDNSIRILTTLLASSIYAVVLYASQITFLPVFLVQHFEGLRTLELAHSTILGTLVVAMIPVGFAAREFLLFPVIAVQPEADEEKEFDSATATLGETFWWNVWGWSAPTKVLIKRTTALLVFQGINVAVQTGATIEGADLAGAIGWAGLWAAAGLTTAGLYRWVGDM